MGRNSARAGVEIRVRSARCRKHRGGVLRYQEVSRAYRKLVSRILTS